MRCHQRGHGIVRGQGTGGDRRQGQLHGVHGQRIARQVAIEAFETYDLTRDLPDAQRAAFTLGPAVSFRFPRFRPGLSALVPIGTPLGGDARAFFAMRLFATIFVQ